MRLSFKLTRFFAVFLTCSASAQDNVRSRFFGKTIEFTSAWCAANEKCKANARRPLVFDDDGALTEYGMGGDPVERKHAFGRNNHVKKQLGDTAIELSTSVSGDHNTIDIVTVHTMRFSSGDRSIKIDRYHLETTDGLVCKLTGSRDITDFPENQRSVLTLISDRCIIR